MATMTDHWHAVALSADQVTRALPLVQVTWPSVDLPAWRSYVQFFNDRTRGTGAGVLALGDSANYLRGILIYEVAQDLHEGRLLTVHLFTAVDLANSLDIVRTLLEMAKIKAMELGCLGLQIRLYNEQAALAARLRCLGLSDRAGYLWMKFVSVQLKH